VPGLHDFEVRAWIGDILGRQRLLEMTVEVPGKQALLDHERDAE